MKIMKVDEFEMSLSFLLMDVREMIDSIGFPVSPHRTAHRYRNIDLFPISYASLPRLRGRLTLRR